MKLINPRVKIIGMTATPFRMGMGMLIEGGLFTDIIHDLTGVDEFNKLIAEGYLCPLVPKRTKVELDVSNVGMAKGDFIGSQLQSAVDKAEITYAGLREAIQLGHDRKSWLIFSSGIEHAEHIASMLGNFGIDCAAVHSKQNSEYNNAAIKAFKSNELRAIVNFSKLTTGFNHPAIDLICDFRPTMSIPLHIQKLGRGTRPANGKENCLVLDFSRNIPRLGPINDPVIPRKKGDKGGEVPVKICEACGTYNHAKVRFCTGCGNEFEFKVKIVAKAGTQEILRSDLPIVEYYDVDRAIYAKKQKDGKAAYIQTTYFCGLQAFREFVFPEGKAYGKHRYHQWWMQRSPIEPPITVDEALKHVSELRCPKRIRVWVNKRYPEVLGAEY
jgi:DNA repair protein RadD